MASLKRFWAPKSIVTRLTSWYAGTLFVLFFAATGFLYYSLIKIISAEENLVLKDRVEAISTLLQKKEDPLKALKQRVELEWASRRFEHIYVRLLKEDDSIIEGSPKIPREVEDEIFPQLISQDEHYNGNVRRLMTTNGVAFLSISTKINVSAPKLRGSKLLAVLDLHVESFILHQYKKFFIIILGIGIILTTFIGTRLARLSFAPVQNLIDTTRRIRATSLHERIQDDDMPTELQNLAQTINEMLDRLEDSFGRLSRFSSDIAHELRTPINNIQGEIQVAMQQERPLKEYQDLILSVHEETSRLSKIIDSLLFLAKSENPELHAKKEIFNLKNEILNIYDFYGASGEEENIVMAVEVPDTMELFAEKSLFQRALSNLISNSINYTDRGGFIKIKGFIENDLIKVSVEDTGRGISENDLPLVFDRFYRVDTSRTSTKLGGFGLGLTIVRSIMQLHKGSVVIESIVGKGTTVTLEFPQSLK